MNRLALPVFLGCLVSQPARAEGHKPETGTVQFRPADSEKTIPRRYRLVPHQFTYRLEKTEDLPLSGVEIYHLTFPSPVKSPVKENNTVHAEYYRPKAKGKFPCVIVLDVTAGNQELSRIIATHLAQNKICGLFVQMAYYGPRRPKGSRLRLLSTNVKQTFEGIRQTVLDLRWAAAWMGSRPEVDARLLGIMGTSLGSFLAALTGEMEPRLHRVAVLLGGGGFVDGYYDHPRARGARKLWEAMGGTREKAAKMIAPVDPITCAANLKSHKLLILAASKDTIVPPKMAKALWKASGKQKIVWYNCNHYSAALYIVPALRELVKHFGAR
jgi:dienelactone hydrolase